LKYLLIMLMGGIYLYSASVFAAPSMNSSRAGSSGMTNVRISGELVAPACSLEGDIEVDFGTIIDKDLYLNQRINGEIFEIKLLRCSQSMVGKDVTFLFGGSESTQLPGLIKTTEANSGIAIGLEMLDKTPLSFNKQTPGFEIANPGNNTIKLRAYVQAEPRALSDHSIRRGLFSATSTLVIYYQ